MVKNKKKKYKLKKYFVKFFKKLRSKNKNVFSVSCIRINIASFPGFFKCGMKI